MKKGWNKLWPNTENKNEAINKSGNEEILHVCQGIPGGENPSIGEVSEWCRIHRFVGSFQILYDEKLVFKCNTEGRMHK